ncbi:unnamed protein product [Heterobilharzia americana]|nr:unnamed protein product [Heterobilharzia americana]
MRTELVDYSDSDSSEQSVSSLFEHKSEDSVDSSDQIPHGALQDDYTNKEDFFNLKDADQDGNDKFWTSTIHNNDLLPSKIPVIKEDQLSSSIKEGESTFYQKNASSQKKQDAETTHCNNKSSIAYVINHEASNISCTNETLIYPRLTLHWPYLALCGPLCRQLDQSADHVSSHILIWKLPYHHTLSKPTLICDHEIHINHQRFFSSSSGAAASPSCSPIRRDYYCWTRFFPAEIDSQCLQLITATSMGYIEIWDINYGKKIREFNVSLQTGPLLRCASLPIEESSNSLLTSGISGIISLWDLRVPMSSRPQLKFSHTELKASMADLLWLNQYHFSSCSDTVDRNVCEHNVGVWDTRFAKPISHQLYQERWGCNRLALKPKSYSSQTICFAVQTQGDAIIEINGKSMKRSTTSNRLSYHLEKRWRYEGHQIQGHPLGLAYNPSGRLLASGSWSLSSPVIWWSAMLKNNTCQPMITSMLKKLPEIKVSPNSMITDVVWIPNQFVPNEFDSLIAVQLNGNIIVYNIL